MNPIVPDKAYVALFILTIADLGVNSCGQSTLLLCLEYRTQLLLSSCFGPMTDHASVQAVTKSHEYFPGT